MKFTHFEGEVSIAYQFVKAKQENHDLVIVFPGYREVGRKPWPEYVMELSSYNANKLFIIDDLKETTAAPFILLDGDFKLERSINGLFEKIIKENSIENIVVAGASGGGSSALYYGLKYNYNFIASSPPILYDECLKTYNELDRIKVLLGKGSDENISVLDKIIPDVIKNYSDKFTKKGFINYGNGEPLVTELKDAKFIQDFLTKNNLDIKLTFSDFSIHKECVSFLSKNFKMYLDMIFEQRKG